MFGKSISIATRCKLLFSPVLGSIHQDCGVCLPVAHRSCTLPLMASSLVFSAHLGMEDVLASLTSADRVALCADSDLLRMTQRVADASRRRSRDHESGRRVPKLFSSHEEGFRAKSGPNQCAGRRRPSSCQVYLPATIMISVRLGVTRRWCEQFTKQIETVTTFLLRSAGAASQREALPVRESLKARFAPRWICRAWSGRHRHTCA